MRWFSQKQTLTPAQEKEMSNWHKAWAKKDFATADLIRDELEDEGIIFAPQDWICPAPECGFSNFRRRKSCHKCGSKKPGFKFEEKGDWLCSTHECEEVNFSWRDECRRCGAGKYDEKKKTSPFEAWLKLHNLSQKALHGWNMSDLDELVGKEDRVADFFEAIYIDDDEEEMEKWHRALEKLGEQKDGVELFLTNLCRETCKEGHVREFFLDCGELRSVLLHSDNLGAFTGSAHVKFADAGGAALALGLDGRAIEGRRVHIEASKAKKSRDELRKEELKKVSAGVCFQWQKKGRCRFGDECKFDHPATGL